jgi:methionyl-tRNA synthetase
MARHLVTSALPYVNAVKHLGNLVGSLLPADVHARWLRQEGHEVLFLCGTDEHGTSAELAAEAAGVPVADLCAGHHVAHAELYRRFHLSFDHFGRTSGPATRRTATEVYLRLRARGLVDVRPVTQLYSPTDGRFLPDRLVLGTCPRCGDRDARGDQCGACGRLLDPEDLLAPRSAISGATDLERRTSRHAFLALSRLVDPVRAHLDAHPEWNALTRRTALAWLAEGLRDRCISRDLDWGTPVPDLPGKVFWCWFDAPLGYVGLTREADPEGWQRWWDPDAAPDDLTITQHLGKDNVPFHAVWLPAVLAGAGGLRLPDRVHGLHWLSWYGQRFSTSARRGVFLDRALELLPADVWRWGLLARAPETADSRFDWTDFAAVVNKDLVGQLGNLVHRLGGLLSRHGARVPNGGDPSEPERELWAQSERDVAKLRTAHAELRHRDVIEALRALLRLGNRYLEVRAPWRADTADDNARVALRTSTEHLRLVAAAVAPVVPETAERICAFLGLAPDAAASSPITTLLAGPSLAPQGGPGGVSLAGARVAPGPPLFERVVPPSVP